jgi:Flp pilus assembly protein TadG
MRRLQTKVARLEFSGVSKMRCIPSIPRRPYQLVRGLLGDTAGGSAVIIALSLSAIIGFAGLGTETASWYLIKRSMQGAADTAAATAAAELAVNHSATSSQMTSAAKSIAASYGFVDGTASTSVTVNNPPGTTAGLTNCSSPFAAFNCYVEVLVTQPQTALLSAVFLSSGPTIAARAVALANTTATADGCVVALGEGAHAIDISTIGSPALTLNSCAIYDNSPDTPGALTLGGSATITAKAAYIVGSVSGSGLTTTDGTFTGVNPIPDPYADRSFTWPSLRPNAASNTNCDQNNYSGSPATINPPTTRAYVFCNGIKIVGNKTVNLCPGTYIIDQGTLDLQAGILNAPPPAAAISLLCPGNTTGGVTIVLANDVSGGSPADVKINGNFVVNLTAPTSGTTRGIALYQDRVTCAGCSNQVNGGSTQSITGVIYTPNNNITYSGGASVAGPVCTKLVANTITFKGNSTFNSSCTSSGTGTINATNGKLVM